MENNLTVYMVVVVCKICSFCWHQKCVYFFICHIFMNNLLLAHTDYFFFFFFLVLENRIGRYLQNTLTVKGLKRTC